MESSMSREAMQMALDAFDYFFPTEDGQLWHTANDVKKIDDARQALQQALETEHEPVAHVYLFDKAGRPLVAWDNAKDIKLGDKLYAAPKQWVGLKDEEVSYFRYAATFCDELDTAYMAELIEKDLKEKNT
jgi:hypothetical protein